MPPTNPDTRIAGIDARIAALLDERERVALRPPPAPEPPRENEFSFANRHGDRPIRIDGYGLVYPSGATTTEHHLCEPPTDRVRRIRLQVLYWSKRVEQGHRDFQDLKNTLTRGGWFLWTSGSKVEQIYGPCPGRHEPIKGLETIAAVVRQDLEQLRQIQQEWESLPESSEGRWFDHRLRQTDAAQVEGDLLRGIEAVRLLCL